MGLAFQWTGRKLRVEPSDDIGESINDLRMTIKEDGELIIIVYIA